MDLERKEAEMCHWYALQSVPTGGCEIVLGGEMGK